VARRTRRRTAAWVVALAAFLAGPAGADPAKIGVRVPAAMPVGESARLEILLLDVGGRLVPAPRDLQVLVRGAERLTGGEEFRFPAGEEAIALELVPERAGAWVVEVVVEGFEPVWAPCAAVAAESAAAGEAAGSWLLATPSELPRKVPEHQPWPRPDTPARALAAPPRAVLVRPQGFAPERQGARLPVLGWTGPFPEGGAAAEAERLSVDRSGEPTAAMDRVLAERGLPQWRELPVPPSQSAEPSAKGVLRLLPGEAAVGPGADGSYRLQVSGFWFEGDQPALRAEPLRFNVVADPQLSELAVEPAAVDLPAGSMSASAWVTGRRQGEVALRALYPGGISDPARVRFTPPRPERLELLDLPERVRALGVAGLEVAVRLLDGSGRPTVAAAELPVTVTVLGDTGPSPWPVTMPAGAGEGRTRVELPRFGRYRLSARAAGLEPAAGAVRVSFDWPVLLWALAGGLVGGLVPLLRARRREHGGWQVGRALVLAAIASGVVALMAALGLLDWLAGGDPGGLWAAVARLPIASQAAAFLIGFLAGFAGDAIYQRLRGALGGEA
jgi:hypothetical protein